MRKDVFDSIVAVDAKGLDGLTAEEKRYVERQIKLGRRNGNTDILCSYIVYDINETVALTIIDVTLLQYLKNVIHHHYLEKLLGITWTCKQKWTDYQQVVVETNKYMRQLSYHYDCTTYISSFFSCCMIKRTFRNVF